MSHMDSDLAELLGGLTPSPRSAVAAQPSFAASSAVTAREGAFEGASKFDQLAMWAPAIQSADAEIIPEKTTLDSRSRDMMRNDALVSASAALTRDNIVGAMFMLNAKPKTRVLFGSEDEVWEAEYQEEVEEKFALYAEGPEMYADAQRTKTLTDIVHLAVGCYMATGEVLMSTEWMPDDGRPYRSAFQVIDTDRLSTPYNKLYGSQIRGGVERDVRGGPVAYHIRRGHPTDYTNVEHYLWRRVMARKPWGRPNILHAYDQVRPDQTRGFSPMVAALQEMKMLKSFRKVELQRAVLAATYAASIESELPSAEILRSLGNAPDSEGNPMLEYMLEYLGAINEYAGAGKSVMIDGVKIPVFMPGTKLNLKNPGAQSPQGDKFEQSALRYIAAACGTSYEQFSRDYTSTNYSSAKASRGESDKHMAVTKRKIADRTASFIYSAWLEEAINNNEIEALKRRNVPKYYEGLNAAAYSACDWIGAGMGLIDPLKESQAYILQLNNKITTREIAIAKIHGSDWRNVLRQIAREEKTYKAMGVDINNEADKDMQNALSGSPQERES